MVNLKEFERKAAAVNGLVDDVTNSSRPNEEDQNSLSIEYDQLYSMILDIIETLDCVLSDVEK